MRYTCTVRRFNRNRTPSIDVLVTCQLMGRYLYEVVQKAMDGQGHPDEAKLNPLRAAYQVCHDLCCGMVLEILHAQAQKLATRVGGLWATQLAIAFHKGAQVSPISHLPLVA